MAVYPQNYEGTLQATAPAGGAVVGTFLYNSTTKSLTLPQTAATSGNAFTGRMQGLVTGVAKFTGVAWVQGQSLRWVSTLSLFKITTINTHVSQATAAAAATAAASTGDIILRFPVAGHI
jgi:hypothetical protein